MLTHEFIFISHEEVLDGIEYGITKKNSVVFIPDYIILNNPIFLKGFETYWDYIGNINTGLNYHGITIISNEQIPQFLMKLNFQNQHPCISVLIEQVKSAFDHKKYVVHFGV